MLELYLDSADVEQMVSHPAIPLAVEQFNTDWQQVFGDQLAFET